MITSPAPTLLGLLILLIPTTTLAQGRAFMDAAGNAGLGQPATGNTSIIMEPESSQVVEVWVIDPDPGGTYFNGHQLIFQCAAVGGASGSVEYVDHNPGMGGGGSILIDSTRRDWFFQFQPNNNVTYNETCDAANIFGVIYNTATPLSKPNIHAAFGLNPTYVAQFEVTATADACGVHTLQWNTEVTGVPPWAQLFAAGGATWYADDAQTPTLFQHLDILVDSCGGCDVDDDGIRDDACVWCQCTDPCSDDTTQIEIVFGDMGGPFGDCAPDGVSDSHDRFHALNCFANVDVAGVPKAYPCETAPPSALNVDAGGAFGSCNPDGVCDGNDAFHALNAFSGTSSCSCPLDPAPTFIPSQRPQRRW